MSPIYKVRIKLVMTGGLAEKYVMMPIMPVGTIVHCIPELPEAPEITHWVVSPQENGSELEIDCYLDFDFGYDDFTGNDEETIADWLHRVGFTVSRFR